MEAYAKTKYVRISPRKVKVVLDLIRGKDAGTAMAILKHTPKAASESLIKLLKSACANAEHNFDMDSHNLVVSKCWAPEGAGGGLFYLGIAFAFLAAFGWAAEGVCVTSGMDFIEPAVALNVYQIVSSLLYAGIIVPLALWHLSASAPGCDIPGLLALYNEHTFTGGGFIAPMVVEALPEEKRPAACIGCRSCEAVCPQQLKISEALADFARKLG